MKCSRKIYSFYNYRVEILPLTRTKFSFGQNDKINPNKCSKLAKVQNNRGPHKNLLRSGVFGVPISTCCEMGYEEQPPKSLQLRNDNAAIWQKGMKIKYLARIYFEQERGPPQELASQWG